MEDSELYEYDLDPEFSCTVMFSAGRVTTFGIVTNSDWSEHQGQTALIGWSAA